MREIKFRAWDAKTNKFIANDSYLVAPQYGGVIPWYDSGDTGYALNDVTLMQYTGLKDRNGKEIYHFDILSLPMRFHGDHTLKPSTAVMQWEHDGWYVEDQGECGYNEMEVIGNIYSDPHLLNK